MKIHKKYKVEINVLTPLFISSGEEYSPVELYLDLTAGKLFKIDFNKLAEDLIEKRKRLKDILLEENNRKILDPQKIKSVLGKNIDKYLLTDEVWDVDENIIKTQRREPITFKSFIKDGSGEVFIPGSTLKGAFHNLFMYYFEKYDIREIGKLFGFSDFYFKEKQVKVIEIRRNNRIPQLVEAVVSGKAEGELRFYDNSKLDLAPKDLTQLRDKYLQAIKKYGSKKTISKLKKVENILKEKKSENYCAILPLGFGKGYDLTVGGKHNKEKFIKDSINNKNRNRKIPWQLWNNKLVQNMLKHQRDIRGNDLVKKIEEIFPSTSWEYNNISLGWVGMKFYSL